MHDNDSDIDVLIIGAGISGLVTAYKILKKDPSIKVLLIEASNRIGGHICLTHINEFDSKWINTHQMHVLKLCDELDVSTVRISRQNRRVIWDIDQGIFGLFASYELSWFIRKMNLLSIDRATETVNGSMEEYILTHLMFPSVRNVVRLLVRSTCGISADEISFAEYLQICNGTDGISNQLNCITGIGEFYQIVPNTYEIVRQIENCLNPNICILNSKVTAIFQYDRSAIVSTVDGHQFQVNYVVVAVPMQDVQRIQFVPYLPDEMQTSSQKSMVTTFTATYADHSWEFSDVSSTVLVLSETEQLVYYIEDRYRIYGVLYHCERYTAGQLKEKIVMHLNLAMSPIDWIQRTSEQTQILKAPAHNTWNRIIWASTNVANLHYRGYLNGSVQSGMKAALAILARLRPQLVDWHDYDDVQHANVVRFKAGLSERIRTLFGFKAVLQFTLGFLVAFACRSIWFKRNY